MLPPFVVEALKAHRAAQRVASLTGLVFASSEGAPVSHTNFSHHVYAPLLDRLGARWVLGRCASSETRTLRDLVEDRILRRSKLGALAQTALGKIDAAALEVALAAETAKVRSAVHRAIRRYIAPAGERDPWAVSFHDLRHSAATAALAIGISPKVISEQLGHATVGFTLQTYAHLLPEMQADAAARMQSLLEAREG